MQLSQAGNIVDGKESTHELLRMGTVAIQSAPNSTDIHHSPPSPKPNSWKKIASIAGLGVILFILATVWINRQSSDISLDEELSSPPPAVARHHTEGPNPLEISKPSPENSKLEMAPSDPLPKQRAAGDRSLRKTAFLNCNSWPWSVVFLNGHRLRGNTPLYRIVVPAGKNRLRFENPELGLVKEVEVAVEPGNIKTVAVYLQQ